MPATYEPITTTTLGSAASSITFSSISSAYTDLRIVLVGRGTYPDSVRTTVGYRFNSDSSTNYSFTRIRGDGSSTVSQSASNVNYASLGYMPSNGTVFGLNTVDVLSYAGSTYKTSLATTSEDQNGQGTIQRDVNLWRSSSAITSITLFDVNGFNFNTGTTATLYGIKAA